LFAMNGRKTAPRVVVGSSKCGFVGVTHRGYPRQQRVQECRANILRSFQAIP
jgi:hypothetical protein